MIGQIRGKLIEKQPPSLMIDVHGVGYCLQAPLSTFFVLPEIGAEVVLRTHHIIREDAHLLFGFASGDECRLFQEIIKINGVGPKIALAILSGLTPAEFVNTVMTQEATALQRLPGVGAKTAQRIIVEMQDRLTKLNPSVSVLPVHATMPVLDATQEAITALIALGYKPQEASNAVKKVQAPSKNCEAILKEALQGLAKV